MLRNDNSNKNPLSLMVHRPDGEVIYMVVDGRRGQSLEISEDVRQDLKTHQLWVVRVWEELRTLIVSGLHIG